MKQKFRIDEYAIDKHVGIIRIDEAEETTRGNWVYNSSTKLSWQNDLNKWEPKVGEKVLSDIQLFVETEQNDISVKRYTVVLEITEILNSEYKMSDNSIIHITDIRPYTGKF